ncbi:MAG TPA: DUF3099 domain-containing protein [Pseudonocardia sp.]|nr:DUF3099 domain-containing protein [Pseudonocardia sp.]
MSPDPDDTPVLITDAARSYEDEFATRKRRYTIMMSLRVPCLVLAAVFYHTPWLAASLIILSIPLPWMAVLIANDRLPIKASKFKRYRDESDDRALEAAAKQLEAKEHPIIES